MQKLKIAGVVVLYNPDKDVIHNINSYLNDLLYLVAVDNSDDPDQEIIELIKKMNKVHYVSNSGNMGIAAALNTGAYMALNRACDFLLTMDQDSTASPGMIQQMIDYIEASGKNTIGIVSPFHNDNRKIKLSNSSTASEVKTVMTSGNLLNLEAFRASGPFLEKLFIDYVDIEYCLRLRRKGFKIIRLNRVILKHQLGNTQRHRFLIFKGYTTNHNPIRRYYIVRNRLYVIWKYFYIDPGFCWSIVKGQIKDIFKILFWEREKFKKIVMTFRGIRDFFKNTYGKYPSKN